MWLKLFIVFTLFIILSASPPDQKKLNFRNDQEPLPSTSSSQLSKYYYGYKPQSMPLDLSLKNRQIIQNPRPSTSGKEAICSDCGKSFNSVGAMKYHQQSSHEGRKFDCAKCDRKYTTKPNLEDHDRAVHQEKSELYKCDRCPYQTKRRNTLAVHKSKNH